MTCGLILVSARMDVANINDFNTESLANTAAASIERTTRQVSQTVWTQAEAQLPPRMISFFESSWIADTRDRLLGTDVGLDAATSEPAFLLSSSCLVTEIRHTLQGAMSPVNDPALALYNHTASETEDGRPADPLARFDLAHLAAVASLKDLPTLLTAMDDAESGLGEVVVVEHKCAPTDDLILDPASREATIEGNDAPFADVQNIAALPKLTEIH